MADGGPAFPGPVDGPSVETGMSLRDWFAGLALEECIRLAQDRDGGWSEDAAAACAYSVADAMLRAREPDAPDTEVEDG